MVPYPSGSTAPSVGGIGMSGVAAQCTIRCTLSYLERNITRIMPVLLAVLLAAFASFYPQLETAGYCLSGDCPEMSASAQPSSGAHGAGAHSSGAHGGGAAGSCLMAVLVSGLALAAAAAADRAWSAARSAILSSLSLCPEPPPPRPGY